MDLYRELILEHYKYPRNFGSLSSPTAQATAANASCGDSITMEVIIYEDQVKEVRFSGVGCAISQASASLLTEEIAGKSVSDVMRLQTEDILKLLGTELTPSRIKCAVLPLEVLQKAISIPA